MTCQHGARRIHQAVQENSSHRAVGTEPKCLRGLLRHDRTQNPQTRRKNQECTGQKHKASARKQNQGNRQTDNTCCDQCPGHTSNPLRPLHRMLYGVSVTVNRYQVFSPG